MVVVVVEYNWCVKFKEVGGKIHHDDDNNDGSNDGEKGCHEKSNCCE